ncbi:hypothetical protein IV454_26055 [Massilia antarctica]|uniref:Uncharacterized protein n=1 Tax=Massilia antarctica TaxID=2765360 RepID=A0AA48WBI5_9BURK|nr:hypothetical protein [Massilia antarctica]QPI48921.1 hypothetical protein IV454_26055 [Massilia antarctica]
MNLHSPWSFLPCAALGVVLALSEPAVLAAAAPVPVPAKAAAKPAPPKPVAAARPAPPEAVTLPVPTPETHIVVVPAPAPAVAVPTPVPPKGAAAAAPAPAKETAVAAPAAPKTVPLPAKTVAGPRLLSVEVLQGYDTKKRKRIQEALKLIFQGDASYAKAHAAAGQPLSDNVVGPITLSFITRFWFYYNMDPAPNVSDDSVAALLHFADRLAAHKEWRPDVLSVEFGQWIDKQADRATLYPIRLRLDEVKLPPVLVRYHAVVRPQLVNEGDKVGQAYWYGLTEDDLKTIASKREFSAATVKALKALVEPDTVIAHADFEEEVQAVLADTGQKTAPLLPLLKEHAVTTDHGIGVTDDTLAAIADRPVLPAPLATLLQKMVGMQYPHQQLFARALQDRLSVGIGSCQPIVSPTRRAPPPSGRMSDDDMKSLIAAVSSGQSADPALGARLQTLRNANICAPADPDLAIDGALSSENPGNSELNTIGDLYKRYSYLFEQVGRKTPVYDPSAPITLASTLCGCSDDQKTKVFRFLPFWHGGAAQQIDFSLVSRINYYGVTFDNNGELIMANGGGRLSELFGGEQDRQLDFVTAARRHRVKVDWVIGRSAWGPWSTLGTKEREQRFARLSDNIWRFLDARMTDFPSRARPWQSFGTAPVPVRGDGVTLYFDGYPRDAESVAQFDAFVVRLRKVLDEHDFDLNIMMRRAELNHGIYQYDKLADMLRPKEALAPRSLSERSLQFFQREQVRKLPYFLVLFDEPTGHNKQLLRREIETGNSAMDQLRLLNRMVPVINFDGEGWQQLEDDLIYFNQNFGGVGFWPGRTFTATAPPKRAVAGVMHCNESQSVDDCIQDFFRDPPGQASSTDSTVSKLVCEYRWPLRFTLDLLILILVLLAVTYARSCQARTLLRKHYLAPLAVALLAILVLVALLLFDPYLAPLTDGYLIPAVLVLCLIGMYFYFRAKFKERNERP